MHLDDWLNIELPDISKDIEDINQKYFINSRTIGFSGKEAVNRVIQHFRSAIFPGVYEEHEIKAKHINVIIGNNIRQGAMELCDLIEKALQNRCNDEDKEIKKCTKCCDEASRITIETVRRLPEVREMLQKDIEAAYNGDPAASTTEEILLSYPSINAISIYRIAHILYKFNVPVIPRLMCEVAHQMTGIDIHPGAEIKEYFFIDHGTGVVIGETCTIGKNVKIYQGVTLGAKSFPLDENGMPVKGIKRHPDIEDNVVIYAGATILGGDTVVGHDSVIGGNVWLTHSVPPYSRVYNSQPSPLIKPGKCED